MEVTTFIWMFVVLKVPVVAALWIVWWALKEPEPEPAGEDDGGGSRRPDPHRGPRPPRPPRRGPHSGSSLPSPERVRTSAVGSSQRAAR